MPKFELSGDAAPAEPKRCFRWRQLFQFRLRSLLILMTICAIAIGIWSHRARQPREAAAALRRFGPRVYIRYDFEDYQLAHPRYRPSWLVDTLGVDYFANVQTLDLQNSQVTDAGIQRLNQALPSCNVRIRDAQIREFRLHDAANVP